MMAHPSINRLWKSGRQTGELSSKHMMARTFAIAGDLAVGKATRTSPMEKASRLTSSPTTSGMNVRPPRQENSKTSEIVGIT